MIDKMAGYEALLNNLVDMVMEEQAKLGYLYEAIRMYYPLSSIKHFFENKNDNSILAEIDSKGMLEILEDFPAYAKEKCGELWISCKSERFCFLLSEQFNESIHELKGSSIEKDFIYKLVELVGRHGTMLSDIQGLFENSKRSFAIEKIEDGEFDLLIRFTEGDDRYYYCFKEEMGHVIYHRYLPADYKDLGMLL